MDAFDIDALLEDTDPMALAAALRRKEQVIPALRERENLGQMGLLGGADLAPAASALMQGARQQIGDVNGERQMVLKRALWNQQRQGEAAPDDAMLAQAEEIGIPRSFATSLTKRQLQGLFGSEIQRQRAAKAREEAMQTPEAIADRESKKEAERLGRTKTALDIKKGERDLAINPASPRFGEEWEPLPSSPLIDNENQRMAFLSAAGEAKEARSLAAQLKDMVDAGLGPLSSAEDKTRAESIVTRLQLIGKKVDALGVLSETDITKFIEPQLVNPAGWKVAMQRGLQQFDPKSQLDQYLANLEGKIEASAKTWAVKRKGHPGRTAPASGSAPAAGKIRVRVKETGQTGTMPAANFDPEKYERIE